MERLYSIKTSVSDSTLAETIASLLVSSHSAKPAFIREIRCNGLAMFEVEAVTSEPEKACRMMRSVCPQPDPDIYAVPIGASTGAHRECVDWCGMAAGSGES